MSTTTSAQAPAAEQNLIHRRGSWGIFSIAAVLVLVGFRAASESAMMREFGSDPQMAIWTAYMIVQLAIWLISGCAAAGLTILLRRRLWGYRVALILVPGWMLAIGWSILGYQQATLALAEARDPETSADRLDQLAHFDGIQAGYELDNRIANNSSTSDETLRMLYQRGELGTLMILARNPETPDDILQRLADEHLQNEWIRKSLEGNPSLPETARRKLNAFAQP